MKRSIFFFLMIILCVNSFCVDYIDEEAKEVFDKAMSHYKNNELYTALDTFNIIVKDYYQTEYAKECYYYIGIIYSRLMQENALSSIEYLNKSALLYSGTDISKKSLMEIANIYKKFNQREDLLNTYRKILKIYPAAFDVKFIYFELLDLTDSKEEKISTINLFIDKFPDSPDIDIIYTKLFNIYTKSREFDKAEKIFEFTNPEKIDERDLADFYMNTGNMTKAVTILEELEKDNPVKLLELYKKINNIEKLENVYSSLVDDSETSNNIILEYVDFLNSNLKNQEALKILENKSNRFKDTPEYFAFLFKKANLTAMDIEYFMDESGTKYYKNINNLNKAKNIYNDIVEDDDNIYRKNALLKIIELEKDHLFNWNNLKSTAKKLIREYPASSECKIAKRIMDSYNFDY